MRLVMVQLEVDASNDETINILLRHLETCERAPPPRRAPTDHSPALQLIKRIASSSSRSLLKDTTWLHKTAYNLCIRYATLWTTAQLIGFYSVAAHLAEFAAGSGSVEQETASIALHCRFASVSGRMQEARLLKDETSKVCHRFSLGAALTGTDGRVQCSRAPNHNSPDSAQERRFHASTAGSAPRAHQRRPCARGRDVLRRQGLAKDLAAL